MIRKHIWRNALALCTGLLLTFSRPLSILASENTSEVTTDAKEERLEPDAYFEPVQSNAVEGWPQGPAVWAESAVVMDMDSGAFLYSKNMDTTKYPASITKIMTTLLAIENARLDERVTFSKNAIYGIERNSSHIGIRPGEILSMEECLYAMMLASANEVCLAVAEHIGGSVDGFVEMMNQKAAELGCTNTHFTNPNGLPDEQHYTTAHDMALIAQAAYKNNTFRTVCQTQVSSIPTTNMCGEKRWFQNHHKMLPEGAYYYEGCTGGKTGFTQAALNTLVTYAEKNGRRLVCVSLRTNGSQIYHDTASLLNYGFDNFQNITLYSRTTNAAADMLYPSIYFGQAMTVDKMRSDCVITIPTSVTQDQISYVSSMTNGVITHNYQYNQYTVGTETVSATNFINLMKTGAGIELLNTELNGPTVDVKPVDATVTIPTAEPAITKAPEVTATPAVTEEPPSTETPTPTPESIEVIEPSTESDVPEEKASFADTMQSIIETVTTFDYVSFAKQIPAYIYGLGALLVVMVLMEVYFIFIYFKRRSKRRKTRMQRQKDRETN